MPLLIELKTFSNLGSSKTRSCDVKEYYKSLRISYFQEYLLKLLTI
jgi:hypothetical protein